LEKVGQVFARRVREVRDRHRWNQEDLAQRLLELRGIAPDQKGSLNAERVKVARTESGKRSVSIDEAFLYAAALGVPLLALLDSSDRAIEIAPKLQLHPYFLRDWTSGEPLSVEDIAISESEFDRTSFDVLGEALDELKNLYPGEREYMLASLEQDRRQWKEYLRFKKRRSPEELAEVAKQVEERLKLLEQAKAKIERKGAPR
jgi:transcriptional regulator with XRE-family HTH domain